MSICLVFHHILATSINAYYYDLCDNWPTANAGQEVTEYHVARLFKRAYEKTATIKKDLRRLAYIP